MVFLGTGWLLKEKGHVERGHRLRPSRDRLKTRFDLVMYTLGGIACSVIFFISLAYIVECITAE